MEKCVKILILLTVLTTSNQIYVPDEEINQKPLTYSAGIKTYSHYRPSQVTLDHNYSKVYNHNGHSSNSFDEEENPQRQYPVYNAHTYGNRPQSAKLTQVYVLNGTRIPQRSNPTRQIFMYNKEKRTPKAEAITSCPPHATGQFVYESSCNQFLNCWKGRGYVQSCAPGTLFNPKTLECDFPDKVNCITGPRQGILDSKRSFKSVKQIGCPQYFTGLIPNYTDCSKFINCVSGIENFMDCPRGTLFDIDKNICDFAHKATCFNNENQNLIEQNIDGKLDFGSYQKHQRLQYKSNEIRCPEGRDGLFPHPTDCSKFMNCANGQTFIQSCAPGTLFNSVVKICDFPYNVVCQNSTASSTGRGYYDADYYRNQSTGLYGGGSNIYNSGRDNSYYNQGGTSYYNKGQGSSLDRNSFGRDDQNYHQGTYSSNNGRGSHIYSTSGQNNFDTDQNYQQGTQYGKGHSGGSQIYTTSGQNTFNRDQNYNQGTQYGKGNSGSSHIYATSGENNFDTDQNYHQGSQYSKGHSGGSQIYTTSGQNTLDRDQNYHQGTYGHNKGYSGSSDIYSTSGQGNFNRDDQNYHQGTYSYNKGQGSGSSGVYVPSGQNNLGKSRPYTGQGQVIPFDNPQFNRPYSTKTNYDTQYGQVSQNRDTNGHGIQPTNVYTENEYQRPSSSSSPGYYNQDTELRRPGQTYSSSNPYRPTPTINEQEPGLYNQGSYHNVYQEQDSYPKGTYITRDNPRNNPNSNGFYNSRPSNYNRGVEIHSTNGQRPFSNTYEEEIPSSNFDGGTNNLYNQRPTMVPHGTRYTTTYSGRTQPQWTQQQPSYDNTHVATNIYQGTQQGQRGETGFNQWYNLQNKNLNTLDDETTTSNYDQVVNINHYRKTTTVPFRNSYEPFFGTTRRSHTPQSSDYEDYIPGSQKYTRSTTPRIEKSWPPPFPSTDVNADYVFENEDNEGVTLEAENSIHHDTECSKSGFPCSNEKCISKALVCNGIKDCPNGSDEKKCLEHVSRFSVQKNKKLAILEKEKWNNVSIAACALMCVENQKIRCRSFNYRKIDKTCFLTSSNEGLTGAIIAYHPFDYYERISESINCTDMSVCSNKKCIDRNKLCDGFDDCGDRMDEKGCKPQNFGYSVKLTGSKNKNEGQIEVTAFGKTGYVCDDTFSMRDANVVCKELGYQLGAAEVKGNSYFNKHVTNEMPFYMMDDVNCLGNETKLLDCDFSGWGVHNCLGQEIAGVICKTPVEKCANDYWQCDTGQECLPLAFVCDGLLDCTDGSDEGSQHCDAPTQIRLVNGTSQNQGRLEIKHHGTWGTICDDDFNEDAAKVICRQLGYKGSANVKKEAYFGPGSGPIWLDQVFCSGNESSIEGCSHWDWGEHNCEHSEDVGVICSNVNDYMEKHSLVTSVWKPPQTYPEKCGYRSDNIFNQNDDVHFRVIKASVAKKGDYPWQAAIRVKGKTSTSHWCGAVIISQKFVLTAAHCLIGYSKGAYVIIAGDYNVDEDEGTEQEANIEDFYLHEDFRKGHKMNNDIALVKLKGRGFQLNDNVQAICLPDADTSYETEQNCTISGFGSIESGKSAFSHNLRAGWVPLQKREICTMPHVYGDALTNGMVCAGSLDEGTDSCDGDSGGPLACLYQGVFTLYGLTSWGQHCGYANKPGVYVKVAHYRKWIDDNFQKYSD